MEFVIFVLGILAIAALSDAHDKWHERQMTQPKHFKETIYV
jgi:hypothetical protein